MERIVYPDPVPEAFREQAARRVWAAWVKDVTAGGVPVRKLHDFVFAEAKKTAGS